MTQIPMPPPVDEDEAYERKRSKAEPYECMIGAGYTLSDGCPMHNHSLHPSVWYNIRRATHKAEIAFITSAVSCAFSLVTIILLLVSR